MKITLCWPSETGGEYQMEVRLPEVPAVGDDLWAQGLSGRVVKRTWDAQGVDLDLVDVIDETDEYQREHPSPLGYADDLIDPLTRKRA